MADNRKTTFADEFEIDPARNDGVGHQYDAVVRNREARKRMHGGDCECCRGVSVSIVYELTAVLCLGGRTTPLPQRTRVA